MPVYGLTTTGFTPKTNAVIRAELEASFRSEYGQNVDVDPETSFLGQLIGIVADRLSELWAAAEAVDSSADPDSATWAALDEVAAITGTVRLAARRSTVKMVALGDVGTALAVGRVASVPVTSARFATTAAAVLAAPGAWAGATAYAVGEYRSNGGNIYRVIVAGVSAGAGGPAGQGAAIVDGTVTWRFIGTSAAMAEVPAESEVFGPIAAATGTLTNIETPQAGWTAVTNAVDAVMGRDVETDADLRIRREQELHAAGNAAIEPIRNALLQVAGVTAATIFENVTMVVDADGMPPKSIEALVTGGADADIRRAVFESKAAGIEAHGSNSGVVVDSMGINHTVNFSRPTTLDVWIVADLVVDAAKFPSNGATQVRDALIEFGQSKLVVGKDVVASALVAKAFEIPGLLDATVKIGLAPAPAGSATLPVTVRQQALLDTARITVNVVNGVP